MSAYLKYATIYNVCHLNRVNFNYRDQRASVHTDILHTAQARIFRKY